jgi:hypothetical protein
VGGQRRDLCSSQGGVRPGAGNENSNQHRPTDSPLGICGAIRPRELVAVHWAITSLTLREPVVETRPTRLPVIASLPVSLERDVFLRTLLRELTGTLQDVVGLDEAAGFVSVVGQRIGDQINHHYCTALSVSHLTAEQVGEVLVDLKRRIQGDFFIIEQDAEKIVLGNRACPFGEKVVDRPALCMMTSNVFGVIAAENLGYAKVVLEQTIARGDPGCRVVVYLQSTAAAEAATGREYFQG